MRSVPTSSADPDEHVPPIDRSVADLDDCLIADPSGGLHLAMDIGHLRDGYRRRLFTPEEVMAEVYARIAARGIDHVWISLVAEDEALAAARALDPARINEQPLWGIPFGVKDNIDTAGLPTTAACPDFTYQPLDSAELVKDLLNAGALLIGKCNLDQFATGLNGTRSPFGVPSSLHDPALISGGSSSGSALAVAAGEVSFAIGTDTAGSGRVPAALNGIVGTKPSIGLISNDGVVPACRSLDCPSVFALTVSDASLVLSVLSDGSVDGVRSRDSLDGVRPAALAGRRFAVPDEITTWGSRGEAQAWDDLCTRLVDAGAALIPIDLTRYKLAGDQLYLGPWVAERLSGLADFVAERSQSLLPVTLQILAAGHAYTGVEVFAAQDHMRRLRSSVHDELAGYDALLTPTVTHTFTIDQMLDDPLKLNAELGEFTTFTNLLDLCAVALPVGLTCVGIPFGVTLSCPAGPDAEVASLAAGIESLLALDHERRGVASGGSRPESSVAKSDYLHLAVVGAHLRGQPLHAGLVERQATFVQSTTTAPRYRLYALADTTPAKPGLRRVASGGSAIEVEVYRLPIEQLGGFLSTIRAPLGIGQVELADGSQVHGFICEPHAFKTALDITEYGGWRAYLSRSRAG